METQRHDPARSGDPHASLLRRVALISILVYIAAIVLFYFLAGEQLHLRASRGDTVMPAADSGTLELSAGNVVEQRFSIEIQRLERISVQWGAYYRTNSGVITMELYDLRTGALLLSQSFDAAQIEENGLTTLTADEPIEGLYKAPLLLRLYSDCAPGSALSPLMDSRLAVEDAVLSLNGAPAGGVLCFAASGTDYIWIGLHYWQFSAIGLGLILLFIAVVYLRRRGGKRSYVAGAIVALGKYRFLIRQLVSRDFKTKYKRSVLGVFWSFLNPLLMMLVQYFVFSTIFRADIENYPSYLLIGVVMFNFFSEACGMAMTSILGNGTLITKVYVPKYIYPLTRVMSSVINLGISLIPLVIVCAITGVHFEKSVILSLYFFLCLIFFCLGLGLLLSTSMVFFRDTQFLWSILSMMWMYATPIFYPETIVPDNFRFILQINPVYHFIKNARVCILGGISPEPVIYVQCFLIAMGAFLIGALAFRRNQDKFILYL